MTPATRDATFPRQPTREFTFEFTLREEVDLSRLDDWLEHALGIVVPPVPESVSQGDPAHLGFRQLLWRQLLLIRSCLQLARIPVFEPGSVVSVKEMSNAPLRYRVVLAIVRLDSFAPRCYAIAINQTSAVIGWLMRNSRTEQNTAYLFNYMNKNIASPMGKLGFVGKSTLPVLEVAWQLDIPIRHLSTGIFELGWGKNARRIDRSSTEGDPVMGVRLASQKYDSANLIRRAGLPAPAHVLCMDRNVALQAARKLGWPLVVKPNDCEGGVGVTVDVVDEEKLLSAFELASKHSRSHQVLVERQQEGVCHRLFVHQGALLFAAKRLPVAVRGDGLHSVAELIRMQNEAHKRRPPWLGAKLLPDDEDAHKAMSKAGYTPESVPLKDVHVPLRAIESTQWGGRGEDVTAKVHPDNIALALRCTELFGLDVAGIDIIIADISVPWHTIGAIINEINHAPLFGVFELTRQYIAPFLHHLVPGDGRIPVDVIIGGDEALELARRRQAESFAAGIQCFVTSHILSLTPAGQELHITVRQLATRCKALLMDRQVESLILVVQDDEILTQELPVDRVTSVTEVPWAGHGDEKLSASKRKRLAEVFRSLLAQPR